MIFWHKNFRKTVLTYQKLLKTKQYLTFPSTTATNIQFRASISWINADSGWLMYVLSFTKMGQLVQSLTGDTHTHTHTESKTWYPYQIT
jgi:hypothetical protein